MSELISSTDMEELTGTKLKNKQIQVLRDANIHFVIGLDGKPRTTWYNVNHPSHLRAIIPEEEQPNFGAIGG